MPEVGDDSCHVWTASALSCGLSREGQGLLDSLNLIRASRVWSPESGCLCWSEVFDWSVVLV